MTEKTTFPLQLIGCLSSDELNEVLEAYEGAKSIHPYTNDLELEYKQYNPKQLISLYKKQYKVNSKSIAPSPHLVMTTSIRHPRNELIRIENNEPFDLDPPDDLGISLFSLNALYRYLRSRGSQANEAITPFSLDTGCQILLYAFLCGANCCQNVQKFYLSKYLKLKFMVPGIPDPHSLMTANTARTIMNITDRSSLESVFKEYGRVMRELVLDVKQGYNMKAPSRKDISTELGLFNNTYVGDCFVTCHDVDYSLKLLNRVVDAGAGYISTTKYEGYIARKLNNIERVFARDADRTNPAALVFEREDTIDGHKVVRKIEILPIVMLPDAKLNVPDVKNIIRYTCNIDDQEHPRVHYFLSNFDYRTEDDAEMLKFSFEHFFAVYDPFKETMEFTFMVFDEYYDIEDYSLYMNEEWLAPHRKDWDDVIYNLMTHARTQLAIFDDHRAKVKYKVMIERMDWDFPGAVRYFWMYWMDNGTDWTTRPHTTVTFFSNKFVDD